MGCNPSSGSIRRIAEQSRWYTAIILPLLAFPIIIYFWKVIVWDKVLGSGTPARWQTSRSCVSFSTMRMLGTLALVAVAVMRDP